MNTLRRSAERAHPREPAGRAGAGLTGCAGTVGAVPVSSAPARVRPVRGRSEQDGSVSLLLVVAVLALLTAVGLVVDGGQKLRGTQRADDAAAEAARAAVLSVRPGETVRGLSPQVDSAAAARAAQAYLAAAGVTGSVRVLSGRVQVTTAVSFTPLVLSLIGLGPQTVTGRADARLARGVQTEQQP